jgi:hypothetical protein
MFFFKLVEPAMDADFRAHIKLTNGYLELIMYLPYLCIGKR